MKSGYQVNENTLLRADFYGKRQDVEYVKSNVLGLSKSRNIGLDYCSTKFAYILDDDISFYDTSNLFNLVECFNKTKAQIIVSRVMTVKGCLFKKYPKGGYRYNKISSATVSSIEMAVDVGFLNNNKIRFDEGFGLGTDYPSGEEFIFLSDCLDNNALIMHRNNIVVSHDEVSSGQDFYSSVQKLSAKKEMFKRIFKKLYFFYLLLFFMKKSFFLVKKGAFYNTFKQWFLVK
nr:glycosyltransferase [Psychromonas sp. SA13A]